MLNYPIIKRFLHEGFIVEIGYEEYVEPYMDPRENECNLGTMFCWHPNYTLGDEQFKDHTFDCPACHGTGVAEQWAVVYNWPSGLGEVARFTNYDDASAFRASLTPCESGYGIDQLTCPRCEGEGEVYIPDMPGVAKWLIETRQAIHVLPLSLIDHSGISMSVGTSYACDPGGWDTSRVGFIYTTQERVDELGCPQDRIEEGLRGEVKEYDAYLRGEVYYFAVRKRTSPTEDPDDQFYIAPEDDGGGELADDFDCQMGGYVGDEEGCEAEAKSHAEYERTLADKEAAAVTYWNERDVVTVAS